MFFCKCCKTSNEVEEDIYSAEISKTAAAITGRAPDRSATRLTTLHSLEADSQPSLKQPASQSQQTAKAQPALPQLGDQPSPKPPAEEPIASPAGTVHTSQAAGGGALNAAFTFDEKRDDTPYKILPLEDERIRKEFIAEFSEVHSEKGDTCGKGLTYRAALEGGRPRGFGAQALGPASPSYQGDRSTAWSAPPESRPTPPRSTASTPGSRTRMSTAPTAGLPQRTQTQKQK